MDIRVSVNTNNIYNTPTIEDDSHDKRAKFHVLAPRSHQNATNF